MKAKEKELIESTPLELQSRPNDEKETTLNFILIAPIVMKQFDYNSISKDLPKLMPQDNVLLEAEIGEQSSPTQQIALLGMLFAFVFALGFFTSACKKSKSNLYTPILEEESYEMTTVYCSTDRL